MPSTGAPGVPTRSDPAPRSPRRTPPGPNARSVDDRAARIRFRRAIMLMLMTLVVPGSAQLVAGDRRVGRIAMRIWGVVVVVVVGTLLLSVVHRAFAFWLVADAFWLGILRFALMLLAIGWAGLFMDAWRIGQPLTLDQRHRLVIVGVNGVLSFSVAGALLFGAHLVTVQRDFVLTLFGDGAATGAHDGRYNVLLLGGDSGAGRWGMRPDSMTVASIDATTGRTVLFGLPRNLDDFPFAKGSVMAQQFPHGFTADHLNGVSTWAGDNSSLFPHSKDPGVDATVMAVEGITGLKINYWAMVNLRGFQDLVDAVGGVKLTVREKIPVGGLGDKVTGYIQPGTRVLDGFDALWFARSREGSDDYSRMARQKCVMGAMLAQISPQTMLTHFEGIAKATTGLVRTDMPASEFGRFAELAMKARTQKVATVSFVPPMIDTAHPDIKLIRAKVRQALGTDRGQAPAPSTTVKHSTGTVTGASLGTRDSGYAANQSSDLGASC